MRSISTLFAALVLFAASPARAQAPTPPAAEPAGRPLTLRAALEMTARRNPDLAVAEAEVRRANALVGQALSVFYPSIGAGWTFTQNDLAVIRSSCAEIDWSTLPPGCLRYDDLVYQPLSSSSWYVTVRESIVNARSVPLLLNTISNVDAAQSTVRDAQRNTFLSVARAYYAALTAKRVLASQQAGLDTARAHQTAARARFEAGTAVRLDLSRAELEVVTVQQAVDDAAQAHRDALDALRLLLGLRDADGPIDVVDPPALTDANRQPDGLVRTALRRRPDVAVARIRVGQAERSVTETWAKFLPTLDLQWQLYATNAATTFQPQSQRWAASVILTFPLFDGFLRNYELQERHVLVEQARIRERQLREAVAVEVRRSYRAWEAALRALDSGHRQREVARQALDLANVGYRAGASTSIEVTDAEARMRDAEVNLALRTFTAQTALATLLIATGEDPRVLAR